MEQRKGGKKYPVAAHDYVLLEEVGKGVSSIVYRAKCIPLNEVVAVKVLDLEKCKTNLEELGREAQTMRLVNHPNILCSYCSFVVEQSLWIIMPYMAGGSCFHIMKAAYPDGFEEHVIATILRECLKALEYLHSHGHIHWDVKAGSIFVDINGSVKLGDVGASACIFDSDDRRWSRNSFVGTPCWMAPEVMEQHHVYDFKADIWSFGITALELAHGHAPFSKFPPMKVLLMTLQNGPPGLDYQRDKKFTKAFKEMVAVCLVKDPSKRPTAEKLLKHAFFKRARSCEYITHAILDRIPTLGQRNRNLKLIDAERLAEKKIPFDEQEEKSQNEYKRGVSAWNFDIEDLKAQAALIQDDVELLAGKEEDAEQPKSMCISGESENIVEDPAKELELLPQTHFSTVVDDFQSPVTIHPLRAESTTDDGDHVTRIQSGPLPAPPRKGKDESALCLVDSSNNLQHPVVGTMESPLEKEGTERGKGPKMFEERDLRVQSLVKDGRRSASGPLLAEYVLSYKIQDEERDRSRSVNSLPVARSNGVMSRLYASSRTFSGPLTFEGSSLDSRLSRHISGNRDGLEKGIYVQRGRFSVISEDINLVEGNPLAPHRIASTQALLHLPPTDTSTSNVFNSAAAALPYLRNILQHTVTQQELVSNLIDSIKHVETCNADDLIHSGGKLFSRTASIDAENNLVKTSSERQQELLCQVADLQSRVASLVEELQAAKLRNVALEQQLNAIYGKGLEVGQGKRIKQRGTAEG